MKKQNESITTTDIAANRTNHSTYIGYPTDNSTTTPPFATYTGNVSYNSHTKEVKSVLNGYPYAQTYQPNITIEIGVKNGVKYKSKTKIIELIQYQKSIEVVYKKTIKKENGNKEYEIFKIIYSCNGKWNKSKEIYATFDNEKR